MRIIICDICVSGIIVIVAILSVGIECQTENSFTHDSRYPKAKTGADQMHERDVR